MTDVDSKRTTAPSSVSGVMEPMLRAILGDPLPIPMSFWDGSRLGPSEGVGTAEIRSPDALRRIAWSPGELGFARAYVVGDIDIEGPLAETLRALQGSMPDDIGVGLGALAPTLRVAGKFGALGRPLPPPPEELVPHGLRHSLGRDRRSVGHHYDVGNRFYRLLLGEAMTYSCARFVDGDATSLRDAQAAKHELICRKLGLHEDRPTGVARSRLLDVGCGWGEMVIHAARVYGVEAVGVTISVEQARLARERVAEAGVSDLVEIRIQDYREVSDGPYDAISSIGMAEHVGKRRIESYFATLYGQLRPGGRMLNHAIASIGGSKISRTSFVGRYVFPDGELLDLADTVHAMESAGFEIRDVENLREHYARTIRCWVDNLEQNWDAAVAEVGERRARAWRLYLSGSINGFEDGGLQLQQTLGVKNHPGGRSAMPTTRRSWD